MVKHIDEYAQLSDQELVAKLTSTPVDEKLHSYFIQKKCKQFLRYISLNIYNYESENQIWGEFYEFISKDNWAVIRNWKNKNGATLYSYLACCSTNYFVHKFVSEKKVQDTLYIPTTQNVYEQLSNYAHEEEDENESLPLWEAFEMVNERDRTILQQLVIEEQSALDAAPIIWKFIKHNRPLSEMDPKRVQCTIAMAKHRAQLALLSNLKQIKNKQP